MPTPGRGVFATTVTGSTEVGAPGASLAVWASAGATGPNASRASTDAPGAARGAGVLLAGPRWGFLEWLARQWAAPRQVRFLPDRVRGRALVARESQRSDAQVHGTFSRACGFAVSAKDASVLVMGMSLRLGLVAAVSATLLVALAVGGTVVCWGAYASVRTEMSGAMAGARDVVGEALARQRSGALVSDLVKGFNGQRHVRVTAIDPFGQVWVQSRPMAPSERPPVWFRALIGVGPQAMRIMLPLTFAPPGSALVLQTDPTNEIAEVWRQTCDAFAVMLAFSGGACLAIYFIVGRALRQFGMFDSALQAISDGRYETALVERGALEFVALARGFNRMAGRIREFEQRNRELREQILTLQQEERAQIARDLHDEVGPYLFAINVDAGDIPRLAHQGDVAEIAERAGSIREAAAHIQKHVKAILRQLRPTVALEFGLAAAIGDLIAFWTRRRPDIAFAVEIAVDGAILDRRIEDACYRLVQEAVSNAVRHGRPSSIAVTVVLQADDELCVTVADDGSGLTAGAARSGMGLAGMAERVRALDGRFEIAGAAGAGVTAVAHLPLSPRVQRMPALAT